MITFQKIGSGDESLERVIDIYLSAFPREERRELSSIQWLLEHEESYHLIAIHLDGEVVGMFAYWDLSELVYIEYFAMDANLRGGGLGSKALAQMIEHIGNRKVIFEVELPSNEIAMRRIDFYKRFNFTLWETVPYEQPPYRKEDSWLPMLLMTNGIEPSIGDITILQRRVYNVQ